MASFRRHGGRNMLLWQGNSVLTADFIRVFTSSFVGFFFSILNQGFVRVLGGAPLFYV